MSNLKHFSETNPPPPQKNNQTNPKTKQGGRCYHKNFYTNKFLVFQELKPFFFFSELTGQPVGLNTIQQFLPVQYQLLVSFVSFVVISAKKRNLHWFFFQGTGSSICVRKMFHLWFIIPLEFILSCRYPDQNF